MGGTGQLLPCTHHRPRHPAALSQQGLPTAPSHPATPEARTARAWHRSPSARTAPGLRRELPPLCAPPTCTQWHHTHGKGGGAMGRPPKGQAPSELCAPLSSLPWARGDTFTRQIKPHQLRSAQARCCREHLGGVRLARHGGTAFREREMWVVMGAAGSVFPNLLQVKLVFY